MKRICLILLLVILYFQVINGENRERGVFQRAQWLEGDLFEFVINESDTTSCPSFFLTADILETPGEVLASNIVEKDLFRKPDMIWVDPTVLRLYKLLIHNHKSQVKVFVQLGAFPTRWKYGNTLRLTATLIDNEQTTQIDIKIPKGKKDIIICKPVFILPEYSLEYPGPDSD